MLQKVRNEMEMAPQKVRKQAKQLATCFNDTHLILQTVL